MYKPGLTEKDLLDMAAAGLTEEDFPDEVVEVWPENVQAYNLFASLRTQWRSAGMAGVLGLDYNPLFHKMDRMELTAEEYLDLEDDIRAMEYEALAAMHAKNDRGNNGD